MKKIFLFSLFLVAIQGINLYGKEMNTETSNAQGEKVYYSRGGYVFALTENALEKATDAVAAGDKKAFQQLIDNKVVYIWNKNIEVYIVKNKFTTVKVRKKGGTLEVWTVQEAIGEYPE